MEIKEAIRIVKYDRVSRALSKNTYDAIGKLITIAEQVEMVEGIADQPGYVKQADNNSQWRALIVGGFLKIKDVEKWNCDNPSCGKGAICNFCALKKDILEIRNLFLGVEEKEC